MNTPTNQTSACTVQSTERVIVAVREKFSETNQLCLLRLTFADIPKPEVLTRKQPPFIAEVFRDDGKAKISVGSFVFSSFNLTRPWASSKCCGSADILGRFNELPEQFFNLVQDLARGKGVIFEVTTGRGERTVETIEEVFLFADLPAELVSLQNEQDRLKGLEDWILNALERERQERLEKIKAEGQARAVEQLNKFPRRLDHEPDSVDHYKNRTEVVLDLLRKEWPEFFAAMDGLKQAKTEIERADWQKRVVIGYQADHKALYGTIPEAIQAEAAEFSRDDYYIRLMNEAMNAPKCRVPKIYWQLVGGWIEKNYYQMNEKQLGTAFNRDWNYSR